jgi:hypothetical protein
MNVETINLYGDTVNGNECFSILVNDLSDYNNVGSFAVNCLTHQYATGSTYTDGPIVGGTGWWIMSCSDDGASNTAFGGGGYSGLVEGNVSTTNSFHGFYQEGVLSNSVIEGNNFSCSSAHVIELNNNSLDNNVVISNNTLYSAYGTGPLSGVALGGSSGGSNIQIVNNTFSFGTVSGTTSYFMYNGGNAYAPLTVIGNRYPSTITLFPPGYTNGANDLIIEPGIYYNYQQSLTLTTTGTGPATLSSGALNIPQFSTTYFATSTSATTVNNSTTLVPVNGCTTAGLPVGTYRIDGDLFLIPATSQQELWSIVFSSNCAYNLGITYEPGAGGVSTTAGAGTQTSSGSSFTVSTSSASSNPVWVKLSGIVTVLTAGTTVQWQFAQYVASANNLVVPATLGADLVLTRIQ